MVHYISLYIIKIFLGLYFAAVQFLKYIVTQHPNIRRRRKNLNLRHFFCVCSTVIHQTNFCVRFALIDPFSLLTQKI